MDDLLKLAGELAENNNYKTDSFNEETKPDGDYEVVIEDIKMKTSQAGNEYFNFKLKVLEGDFANDKFYPNFHMTQKTTKATLSKMMKLLNALGYEIDLAMFNSTETMFEGLKALIGETVTFNKTTSNGGFINYSFKGGE